MDLQDRQALLDHFQAFLTRCNDRDTRYCEGVSDNPQFVSAWDASLLVRDNDVVALTGIAANQRASIMYWAIQERFLETGSPHDLTIVIASGAGARGKMPGSVEELGVEGLCRRLISGHVETYKSFLRLADAGSLELQCIPQGVFVRLLHAMAQHENSFATHAGAGTFIDPRVGRGTPVLPGRGGQLVDVDGEQLRFHCPPIDVAIFNLPAADRKGNLYARHAAVVCEAQDSARAAKVNGGRVIANVGEIVEEGYDAVFIPAEDVDAIVVYPETEQVVSVPYRKYWSMFTTESEVSTDEGIARVRYLNDLLGITPKRSPVDEALARFVASTFMRHARRGSRVDIGVGLPEEAARLLYESGTMDDLQMLTESGLFGGMACPGIFFGASINPDERVTSYEAFRRMYERLDVAILGLLEADSEGNVNVSKRGDGAINYVGPGGFIDITTCAKLIIFCGTWMAHATMAIEAGELRIASPGAPKFVDRVDEITFSGAHALKRGQTVLYVTNVGAFQLTDRGMELVMVVPGIDIERDIVAGCPMRVVIPDDRFIPTVPDSVMTGRDFRLEWDNARQAERV